MNKYNIFLHYIQLLGVKHTKWYANKLFNEHPYKNNMYGLSMMLDSYHIDNFGYHIDTKDLTSLPVPFIAHINDDFIIVTKISENDLTYYQQGKKFHVTLNDFHKIWDGNVLITKTNRESKEPSLSSHQKEQIMVYLRRFSIPFCFLFLIFVGVFKSFLYTQFNVLFLFVINLAGLYLTYLLLRKTISSNSKIADKICLFLTKSDCGQLITSEYSKAWGSLSWSEVGFSFFLSNSLLLLFFPKWVVFVQLLNILAIPFTLWSVWFQYRTGLWCGLCLFVQCLLWIMLVNLFFFPLSSKCINILSVLFTFCLYILVLSLTTMIVSIIQEGKTIKRNLMRLNTLKMKEEVFFADLMVNKRLRTMNDISNIVFGDKHSDFTITVVTNPHCKPCGEAYRQVEKILKKYSNICVQFVFHSFPDKWFKESEAYLISAYFSNTPNDAQAIFSKWYMDGVVKRDQFISKYPSQLTSKEVLKEQELHQCFCKDNNITSTPTLFVNSYLLPSEYIFEDLLFLDLNKIGSYFKSSVKNV